MLLFLSRHYRPIRSCYAVRRFAYREPRSRGPYPGGRSPGRILAALLDVRADELLGVLLQHLVDLVEDGVHVVGELLVPLLDFLGTASLGLFGLFGAPRGLPLTACVLRCHVTTSVSPNAIVTRGSPAQSRQPEIGTDSLSGGGRRGPPRAPAGARGGRGGGRSGRG